MLLELVPGLKNFGRVIMPVGERDSSYRFALTDRSDDRWEVCL